MASTSLLLPTWNFVRLKTYTRTPTEPNLVQIVLEEAAYFPFLFSCLFLHTFLQKTCRENCKADILDLHFKRGFPKESAIRWFKFYQSLLSGSVVYTCRAFLTPPCYPVIMQRLKTITFSSKWYWANIHQTLIQKLVNCWHTVLVNCMTHHAAVLSFE